MITQFEALTTFAALARTATANGSTVDLRGYVNPGGRNLKAVLNCGAASGTTPTLDVKMQESSNGSSWADISGATFTQLTTTGGQEIHFRTNLRYVRAVATLAGTTPNFTFYVGVVAQKRQDA